MITDDARAEIRLRFEVERERELKYLRSYIKRIAQQRMGVGGYVTADDVAEQYDRALARGDFPVCNRAFLGQVFKTEGWSKVEGMMVASRRPNNRGRKLCIWQWKP